MHRSHLATRQDYKILTVSRMLTRANISAELVYLFGLFLVCLQTLMFTYDKCLKFRTLFSTKMSEINKMLDRKANREDPA